MRAAVASMAVPPGGPARAARYAREGTPARARGLAGSAASDDDKANLTASALSLFARSQREAYPGEMEVLRQEIAGAQAWLGGYDPWYDSSRGWVGRAWDESQIVRANLQAANANVMTATGQSGSGDQVASDWRQQEAPVRDVSVWSEFAGNLPGELASAGSCAAKGMRYDGQRCVPLPGAGFFGWIAANPKKAAAALGGVVSLGVLGALAIKGYFTGLGGRATNAGRARRNPEADPPPLRRARQFYRRKERAA